MYSSPARFGKDTQVVHSELRVDLEGDEIVVTLTGTKLRANYSRSHEAAQLIQRPYMATDNEAPLPREEFEALDWEAANDKARELGWIV